VTVDVAETLVEGPWRHRFVAANGARFHVVDAGAGPLVLLLHGFPEFWWAWRAQLVALAEAGYHAVAMDLRGYGASDKPPRGYDTPTSAADVAGVVRALGAQQATIVGHDWGGWIAWSMPGLQPRVTQAVGALGMAHPLTLRGSLTARRQRRAVGRLLGFQAPLAPERSLGDKDGVARVLRAWAGPGWPDAESEWRYTRAMRVPFVAHTSMEYYRWAVRSVVRSDGRRFAAAVREPVRVPVLQIHGGLDPWVLPETAVLSASRVDAPLRFELLPAVGHFLPEEAPGQVTAILLDWLGSLRRARVRPLSSSGR
jgi:pimeloyl-ACP methyl ester carboxylesterase